MEEERKAKEISGGAAVLPLMVPLMIEFGPVLIEWAMKIYQTHAQKPETPEVKRAHYAEIARSLETTEGIVLSAPQPPPGSGR